ncbi:MAG: thiamine biosynthesis protein ThiS [Gammaproteobacteria bacterium RIFCSPLOWO2_02_FULL_57_10]|nr:MAG: thiamine biosynthesis protein ThiS [Gammaproteobacteria bacterium RIFCSPLOWO2_02_FULL_57_10]
MHVKVNGDDVMLASGATLADLLQELALGNAKVAIELNHTIVPRSQHAQQTLNEGDQIEIVHAIGGG